MWWDSLEEGCPTTDPEQLGNTPWGYCGTSQICSLVQEMLILHALQCHATYVKFCPSERIFGSAPGRPSI